MRQTLLVIVVLLLAGLTGGCGDSAEANGPPEISYGRDICIECNMIISEPRFAASYRLDDGETKSFDGIGELVKHAQRLSEFERIAFAWVHDYNTEDWLLADEAFFVAGHEIVTPMGHGIVAFTSEPAADRFAADVGGEVMRWPDVVALPLAESGLLGRYHDMDEMSHEETGDGMSTHEHGDMEMSSEEG